MAIFVATYTYVGGSSELARLRPQRYAFFQQLEADGALLASGQLVDSELADGMLILRASSAETTESLLDADPFEQAGLVAQRTLSEWNPTLGSWAS